MQDKLTINPENKWEFDSKVTECFDDMLERSIPNYQSMRDLTYKLGRYFIQPETSVLDIGCSRGLSVDRFIREYPLTNFWLIDTSEPMIEVCKDKYQLLNNVKILNADICRNILPDGLSLCLSVLTLQFIEKSKRQNIVNRIYESLNSGCAFILVEKLNAEAFNDIFTREYYDIKQKNGYSPKQIADKRESLKGVMEPLTEQENIEMLNEAGFKYIECFYRCLNFGGWLAVKA